MANERNRDLHAQPEAERRRREHHTLWYLIGLMLGRWKFLALVTSGVAVGAVIISLLLPEWYRASTRLLLPEGSQGGPLAAMLSDLGPVASSLVGGSSADYSRYISILSSRTLLEDVVDRFNLVDVYETGDTRAVRANTRSTLLENVDFEIDEEFGYLSISVLDKDPERAAEMANYFVQQLNQRNSELLAQSASNYRLYMESAVADNATAIDSLRSRLQRFQQEYGVIDLPTQAETFLETVAELRAQAVMLEIEFDVLRSQYGDDHPSVIAANAAQRASNRKIAQAFGGSERLLPVQFESMPLVARQYAELTQEMLVEGEIMKLVRPLYEQARYEEEREKVAVQVVDEAVPPEEKAKPFRMLIVALSTLSALMLAIAYVLLSDWYVKNRSRFLTHVRSNGGVRTSA